jgi:hypothetical protein
MGKGRRFLPRGYPCYSLITPDEQKEEKRGKFDVIELKHASLYTFEPVPRASE